MDLFDTKFVDDAIAIDRSDRDRIVLTYDHPTIESFTYSRRLVEFRIQITLVATMRDGTEVLWLLDYLYELDANQVRDFWERTWSREDELKQKTMGQAVKELTEFTA